MRNVFRLRRRTARVQRETDHVHLLVRYPSQSALSRLVNSPQGRLLPALKSRYSCD
ncbi:transposase [Lentzea sp. NBC_00516]|uniref:transposase n=1 Tax=Lentzea sp. NBC_00516 TaxID=2903582 RepID=UPI003FA60C7C